MYRIGLASDKKVTTCQLWMGCTGRGRRQVRQSRKNVWMARDWDICSPRLLGKLTRVKLLEEVHHIRSNLFLIVDPVAVVLDQSKGWGSGVPVAERRRHIYLKGGQRGPTADTQSYMRSPC